jgi:hypothetical protein
MKYLISHPPTSQPFHTLTRKEAKTYYNWFIALIPERIALLEQAVRSSYGKEYRTWSADMTPTSLDLLGQWFTEHMTTRPFSERDRRKVFESLNKDVPPKYWGIFDQPEYVLTMETHSLIVDVGMYLGEVFRTRYSQVQWQLYTRGKYWHSYHEPVLSGFGKKEVCNPVDLVHVLALKIVQNQAQPSGLRELFDYWSFYLEHPEE